MSNVSIYIGVTNALSFSVLFLSGQTLERCRKIICKNHSLRYVPNLILAKCPEWKAFRNLYTTNNYIFLSQTPTAGKPKSKNAIDNPSLTDNWDDAEGYYR